MAAESATCDRQDTKHVSLYRALDFGVHRDVVTLSGFDVHCEFLDRAMGEWIVDDWISCNEFSL
jgi:hypothetical protein